MSATRVGILLRCARALVLAFAMLGASASATAAVFVSVAIAPPALPVYAQPVCPGPGYLWTPGYWAYGPAGYYWVPGTWVIAPYVGALWTPGYWGWANGLYVWHAGYWGPHVGFYGGINYGFGYVGVGYAGGYWRDGALYYNRSVTNVNVNVHNTYNTTVVNNTNVNRVSFNGGEGGVRAEPTAAEQAAMRETHTQATAAQLRHEQASGNNRAMLASVNQGRPSIAATPRPGAFGHPDSVAAEGAVKRNRNMAQSGPSGQGSGHPRQHQQGHSGQPHEDEARAEGQGHGEHHGEGHAR